MIKKELHSSVGRSDRTELKHNFLRKLIGREIGVCKNKGWAWSYLDLTAGDSCSDPGSSLGIVCGVVQRGTETGRCCQDGILRLTGIERDTLSFARLKSGACEWQLLELFRDKLCVLQGDARELANELDLWPRNTRCLFILNDPNKVSDFAITTEIRQSVPKHTTTFSTLGCNAQGLKRLPFEERRKWYDPVHMVIGHMLRTHDAILIVLDKDSSQWAYLVTGPMVWKDDYERDARAAFKGWKHGISYTWYRKNERQFELVLDKLFLTKNERDCE